jgi:uncharacterized protein (TIGR00297 family)
MDYLTIGGFILFVLFSIFLLSIKAFDVTATIVAILFGIIILKLQGRIWFFTLIIFLIVSLWATYYGKKVKHEVEYERRSIDNVISNGLVAFMATIFSFPYVFLGSVAAALSDTISSEIGVLSLKEPRLLLNPWKKVPAGTNGAISILGTIAAVMGAAIIAAMAFLFSEAFIPASGSALLSVRIKLFIAVFAGGFIGCLADSAMGYLENQGLMTNGSVNFSATLIGGLITAGIMYL